MSQICVFDILNTSHTLMASRCPIFFCPMLYVGKKPEKVQKNDMWWSGLVGVVYSLRSDASYGEQFGTQQQDALDS